MQLADTKWFKSRSPRDHFLNLKQPKHPQWHPTSPHLRTRCTTLTSDAFALHPQSALEDEHSKSMRVPLSCSLAVLAICMKRDAATTPRSANVSYASGRLITNGLSPATSVLAGGGCPSIPSVPTEDFCIAWPCENAGRVFD